MTLWDLPGARRFVESVCASLLGGSSAIVRFPGAIPEGFDAAVAVSIGNALDLSRLPASACPLDDLRRKYAGDPNLVTYVDDLCREPSFRGRLIRLDGVTPRTWPAWSSFLTTYAQATRSRPLLGRSLFLVVLNDVPQSFDDPVPDVALASLTWDDALDEIDLLMFARERLRGRPVAPLLRSLLATTIARVAAWDFDTAACLVDEDDETILAPRETLRAMAQKRGWTRDTPQDWRIGTASRAGVAHAARAALDQPTIELDRRLWSAQLAVLLPWIETRRHDIIANNLYEVRRRIRAAVGHDDVHSLEIGDLHKLLATSGANRQVRRAVERLRAVRNRLAHRNHVSLDWVKDLVDTI